MLKYLLLFAVLLVFWLAWSARRRARDDSGPAGTPPASRMIRCAHCGLYLPEGEAQAGGGELYCSEAHRRAGPRPL